MPTSARPQALLVIRRAGCPHPAARPRTALPAEISAIARSGATWQSVPPKAPLHLVMHTGAVICPLLFYLSYPIFQKKQGFPCEFFVISPTSSFFLLPNAPTCSKITPLTVLRVKLRSRSCAMDAHESCQAGNRAALRGIDMCREGAGSTAAWGGLFFRFSRKEAAGCIRPCTANGGPRRFPR